MGKIKPKEKKWKGTLRYFFRNFSKKHRVSVRDQRDDTEVWYMYISSMRALLAGLGMFLLVVAIVVLIVVYTPVLDKLPGTPGKQCRELLIENILRVDSLERELHIIQSYSDNVALVMEGKTPMVRTMRGRQDTLAAGKALVPLSEEELALREQMEGPGRYSLSGSIATAYTNTVRRMDFQAPVMGDVSTPFDPRTGMYGVGLTLHGSQQVVAAQYGTVVMSFWSPDYDYVIQIQHKDNYISVYKWNSQLLKKVGDTVRAGEVIAYVEADTEGLTADASREFVFELWSSGTPVDPQRYIFF